MPLNKEKIEYFIKRIQNNNVRTFTSEVSQLFQHLDEGVKDNKYYTEYEKGKDEWTKWVQKNATVNSSWVIPNDYEKAKALSYILYRLISDEKEEGSQIPINLILENRIEDCISEFNSIFLELFVHALNDIILGNPELELTEPQWIKGDTVFIVHGHDNDLKREVQLFLQKAMVRSVVLHEEADKGRSVLDKLIDETKNANYAIALLTPDDISEDGSKRARQNVILEIGYFIGKIGKERVRMIVKDILELPSDLQGILYTKYDVNGAWKLSVLKELNAMGIFVDLESYISNS